LVAWLARTEIDPDRTIRASRSPHRGEREFKSVAFTGGDACGVASELPGARS